MPWSSPSVLGGQLPELSQGLDLESEGCWIPERSYFPTFIFFSLPSHLHPLFLLAVLPMCVQCFEQSVFPVAELGRG